MLLIAKRFSAAAPQDTPTTRSLRHRVAMPPDRPGERRDPMNPEVPLAKQFFAALEAAGMPEVPGEFSVVPQHQIIPTAILAEISDFIHAFDRVTAREAWQAAVLREAPAIVQL